MATIEELKRRIDLHDLADRLGLKRGKGAKANYHCAQGGGDSSPSLSIQAEKGFFKCFKHDEGGDCIDLFMHAKGCDKGTAIRELHLMYGLPLDKPAADRGAPKERSRAEFIAEKCLADARPVGEYLRGRGITDDVVNAALAARAVGWNTWRSDRVPEGEVGHGGPAAAFIVRSLNPGHVVAVDLRYVDPALNGKVKTQSQGEKEGYPWTSNVRRLHAAHTVYVVESAINALSIECVGLKGVAALATRGTATVEGMNWRVLAGKRVVLAFDNDEPDQDTGLRPGLKAAWRAHELCTGLNISAMLLDQTEWEHNDLNDVLQADGVDGVRSALLRMEECLIPGLPWETEFMGKRRVFLPAHDFANYWRYRVKDDFTRIVTKMDKNEDSGVETPVFADLCGFRVAAISRVAVASSTAVMTGDEDHSPTTYFAISVQVPRHGYTLQRRVFTDDRLHNVEHWKKLGPIFNPAGFLRMVNILERSADIGARHAVNFVGLAWRNGKLIVNEGPDCYFTEPEKQCPYHNLTFPSGTPQDARTVLLAYQSTFKQNAAVLPLVWALGGHLKAFLGFWPHCIMQADKGAGKSTLIKRIERTIAFTMFSGQSLATDFRLLTSISHTSHPVGWEELSARKQEVIDKAVAMLQESYQYAPTRRGPELTEFLQCAPVMLAGEDVPVRSLTGKVVRTDLTGRKGDIMADSLPFFPVRQWLEFLTQYSRAEVQAAYERQAARCRAASRASGTDDGAVRMANNYAAVLTAWRALCEFAGLEVDQGDFERDLIAAMNAHIAETSADRAPWVWILETALSEIAAKRFQHPVAWDVVGPDKVPCLLVRTSFIMDHIAHSSHLRDKWNGLPVKSDRVFKRQLVAAGVVVMDDSGQPLEVEKTIGGDVHQGIPGKRIAHLTPISLPAIGAFGLHATPPADLPEFPPAPPQEWVRTPPNPTE